MSEIVKFTPLDCQFIHRWVHDEYPFDDMAEGWVADIFNGHMVSELVRARLGFFFYLFMYEKYGNLVWEGLLEQHSSIEAVKDRYPIYLKEGGLDKAYYRKVIGI